MKNRAKQEFFKRLKKNIKEKHGKHMIIKRRKRKH